MALADCSDLFPDPRASFCPFLSSPLFLFDFVFRKSFLCPIPDLVTNSVCVALDIGSPAVLLLLSCRSKGRQLKMH